MAESKTTPETELAQRNNNETCSIKVRNVKSRKHFQSKIK